MPDTPKDRKELKKFLWDYGDSDLLVALDAAGLAIVPVEPTEEMLSACVVAFIDAGLDGPDGIGHYEADKCFLEIIAASPFREKADD